jgi:hypothetical protein
MNAIVQDSLGGRPVQVGDVIRIARGPFAGLFGTAAGISGSRATVVATMSGRRLSLEMDIDWVDATPPRRRSVSSVEESGIQHRAGS